MSLQSEIFMMNLYRHVEPWNFCMLGYDTD